MRSLGRGDRTLWASAGCCSWRGAAHRHYLCPSRRGRCHEACLDRHGRGLALLGRACRHRGLALDPSRGLCARGHDLGHGRGRGRSRCAAAAAAISSGSCPWLPGERREPENPRCTKLRPTGENGRLYPMTASPCAHRRARGVTMLWREGCCREEIFTAVTTLRPDAIDANWVAAMRGVSAVTGRSSQQAEIPDTATMWQAVVAK